MISLFNDVSYGSSKLITQKYSTSFTLGIKMLHKRLHNPIYGIYGMVRVADEIVDTFHEYDKKALLQRFKEDTLRAIREGISTNPVLHAYQKVVNEYQIEEELTLAFFESMEMDLHQIDYNANSYNKYIYGSAEVVGLMCLRIFAEGDDQLYQKLKPGAKALGAAFQKVNFLRDMKDDFQERGRTYFPNVDFIQFSKEDKQQIELDIANDFEVALTYIKMLPMTSQKGVMLAYEYYQTLFQKIKDAPASEILKKRFRVPNFEKFLILVATAFNFKWRLF